ncbi:hypothetical protein PSHT_00599 [Puccinia striiformis]|uniref:Uncharacterized protein n=1 Tax=Puccinia striiformis TaxID=27350 RepID=A0A2S4WMX6_9BASI|nr:hypothetical protein PSHT_00599 [Puccinia striiformis]
MPGGNHFNEPSYQVPRLALRAFLARVSYEPDRPGHSVCGGPASSHVGVAQVDIFSIENYVGEMKAAHGNSPSTRARRLLPLTKRAVPAYELVDPPTPYTEAAAVAASARKIPPTRKDRKWKSAGMYVWHMCRNRDFQAVISFPVSTHPIRGRSAADVNFQSLSQVAQLSTMDDDMTTLSSLTNTR